jgi:hypothetical protein
LYQGKNVMEKYGFREKEFVGKIHAWASEEKGIARGLRLGKP